MAMLSYKAKCQHNFLVHFLDIQGSTKAQHSPLLISEQSRSSAGVSGTKSYGYSPSPSLDALSPKLVVRSL